MCVCVFVCVRARILGWGCRAALAELKSLQLLENLPWGRRASGNGYVVCMLQGKANGLATALGLSSKTWECVNQGD